MVVKTCRGHAEGIRGAITLIRTGDERAPSMARTHLAHDAWQAASLLIGLFGSDASNYAAEKMASCMATRDLVGATTWNLIASQIDLLLTSRTDRQVS